MVEHHVEGYQSTENEYDSPDQVHLLLADSFTDPLSQLNGSARAQEVSQ
jgi:hypothetical protein